MNMNKNVTLYVKRQFDNSVNVYGNATLYAEYQQVLPGVGRSLPDTRTFLVAAQVLFAILLCKCEQVHLLVFYTARHMSCEVGPRLTSMLQEALVCTATAAVHTVLPKVQQMFLRAHHPAMETLMLSRLLIL